MDDNQIIESIDRLVAEERALRERGGAAGHGLEGTDRERLTELEERLDQCWDLLRQRRAREDAGQDPAEAKARPVADVESYLQ